MREGEEEEGGGEGGLYAGMGRDEEGERGVCGGGGKIREGR